MTIYTIQQWINIKSLHIRYTSKKHSSNNILRYGFNRKTTASTAVYAIMLDWPDTNSLTLGAVKPSDSTTVSMLGLQSPLKWQKGEQGGMVVQLPIGVPLPCQWAWVLKIEGL